jgi:hypothetical protein
MEMSSQLHAPVALYPKKTPSVWMGGWADFRARLDAMENRKILPLPRSEARQSIP